MLTNHPAKPQATTRDDVTAAYAKFIFKFEGTALHYTEIHKSFVEFAVIAEKYLVSVHGRSKANEAIFELFKQYFTLASVMTSLSKAMNSDKEWFVKNIIQPFDDFYLVYIATDEEIKMNFREELIKNQYQEEVKRKLHANSFPLEKLPKEVLHKILTHLPMISIRDYPVRSAIFKLGKTSRGLYTIFKPDLDNEAVKELFILYIFGEKIKMLYINPRLLSIPHPELKMNILQYTILRHDYTVWEEIVSLCSEFVIDNHLCHIAGDIFLEKNYSLDFSQFDSVVKAVTESYDVDIRALNITCEYSWSFKTELLCKAEEFSAAKLLLDFIEKYDAKRWSEKSFNPYSIISAYKIYVDNKKRWSLNQQKLFYALVSYLETKLPHCYRDAIKQSYESVIDLKIIKKCEEITKYSEKPGNKFKLPKWISLSSVLADVNSNRDLSYSDIWPDYYPLRLLVADIKQECWVEVQCMSIMEFCEKMNWMKEESCLHKEMLQGFDLKCGAKVLLILDHYTKYQQKVKELFGGFNIALEEPREGVRLV